MSPIELLFWLLVLHVLCDYPLQGDFVSKAKNRYAPIPGVPAWLILSSHALLHAGAVHLLLDNLWLAAAEFVAHWLIDDAKCINRIRFVTDQALHVACKVAWVAIGYALT